MTDGVVATNSNISRNYAVYAVIALFVVNLLNYIDRYVLMSLLPLIEAEFHVSDTALGALGAAFFWVYMIAAIPFGYLADRWVRNHIVAGGLVVWSAATALSGLAPVFLVLFLCRAFVGVGEAAYASASPTMIADYFRPKTRNRALMIFYIGIPVGSGLGYMLGGWLGEAFGWRNAFYFAAAPGLLFALPIWRLREPKRGGHDISTDVGKVPFRESIRRLLKIKSYVWVVTGQIASTFALGGVSVWLPTYFVRSQDMSLGEAGTFSGSALVIGSLFGTIAGGLIADWWHARSRNGLIHTISTGFVISAALLPIFFYVEDRSAQFILLVITNFFLFWHTGPINTVIANVASPNIRGMAIAFQILMIHLLGDAASPWIMGLVSDTMQAGGMAPGPALRVALLWMLPIPIFLAAVFNQIGAIWAPADMVKVVGPHPLDGSEPDDAA